MLVLTPLALVLGVLGAGWGFVADRIGARWPAHEDGRVRPLDWRTPVPVAVGGLSMGALTFRFEDLAAQLIFGAWFLAVVLLLAIDLDQRLLPDVVTLPAIPLALGVDALGLNPLVPVADLPLAVAAAVGIPVALAVVAIPFGAGAFGTGDVKLLVSTGLLAGPYRLFTGVVWGALLAGAVILVLLAARRITLKSYIPFGPFLIIGGLLAILNVR